MNFRVILIFTCFLFFGFQAQREDQIPTETNQHIFWQTSRKLAFDDFQGLPEKNIGSFKQCEEYAYCTVSALGIFGAVDIPKKKKDRGILKEKVYFAAAMDKSMSYLVYENDSFGVAFQQLLYDVYEIEVRKARLKLKVLQDTMKGFGTASIFFATILADAKSNSNKITRFLISETYVKKNKASFPEWRARFDTLLETTKEFATTPEDCYRFVLNEPITKDYIPAKNLPSSFRREDIPSGID